MASLLLPAITFRSPTSSTLLPSVPIRLPEAPAEIATPPPKIVPEGVADRLRAVVQSDRSRDVGADPVARHGVARGALPGDPDAGEQVAAEQVPLARIVHPVAVGPDQVAGCSRVDLDPDVVGHGLRAGRIGAEEVAIDPVAGRAGSRDVNAGALGEATDVQAADRDIRARDRQAVTAAGLAAAQLDQRRAGIARLGEAVDQDRPG